VSRYDDGFQEGHETGFNEGYEAGQADKPVSREGLAADLTLAPAVSPAGVVRLAYSIPAEYLRNLGGKSAELTIQPRSDLMSLVIDARADSAAQVIQLLAMLQTALASMERQARDQIAGKAAA